MISTAKQQPNALLLGVDLPEKIRLGQFNSIDSMSELADLAKTAEIAVACQIVQKRESIDNSLYIGSGKAEELLGVIESQNITVIITDDELSPNQQKNLEKLF